jgi:(3S)-malyl-CoA thioesterase
MTRPYRSVLYIPASNARAMDKAKVLPVDALILDLEDAVAPAEKDEARDALARVLRTEDFGHRARLVRVNGLGTSWADADIAAFANHSGVDGLLLPKVQTVADLDLLAGRVAKTPLWAMMETPLAMLNAAAIAGHPRLAGMVMGTNDLAKDIGARFRPDRLPLTTGLGLCLLAARAHGRVIVDGVYNALRDEDGFVTECAQGRDMGFDGKSLIHPAQIAAANAAFSPSDDEVAMARRQIEAHETALRAGQGVAVLDGLIVENLHVATARAMLARAETIAASGD